MTNTVDDPQLTILAAQLIAETDALPVKNTATMRRIRRKYSWKLKAADADFVLALARTLIKQAGMRWVAHELIANHPLAFKSITEEVLEEFGQGINSWYSVDDFARTLAGPAWREGQVRDERIRKWAESDDPWWRRAALVSTVAWNVRSQGGKGDAPRTLEICSLLARDRDDMVVKAMSWALRELVIHDAKAVSDFLSEYEDELAARVKREVKNKLLTGYKNPKQHPR